MTDPFTLSDWRELPEGFPAQLVGGLLVKDAPPSVRHQQLVGRLFEALLPHGGADRVLVGPVGIAVSEHDAYHPDLVVLERTPPAGSRDLPPPPVVVEVLSPSTEEVDRGEKLGRYLDAGCEEVWLVDPARRVLEVHTLDGSRHFEGEDRVVSAAVPALDLVVSALFRP